MIRSQSEFNRKLDRLYQIRTDKLRHIIGPGRKGKSPTFDRELLDKKIEELKEIASRARVHKSYRKEFHNRVEKKKSWHITGGKGFKLEEKEASFKEWYEENFYPHRTCIYIFWKNRKCLYVGKTERAPGRIISHIYSKRIGNPTRIDVYLSRGKSDLPILECLAIHKFGPTKNRTEKSPKRKYSAKCPICTTNRKIHRELHRVFVFKRRR
jgi:hypothetical protein